MTRLPCSARFRQDGPVKITTCMFVFVVLADDVKLVFELGRGDVAVGVNADARSRSPIPRSELVVVGRLHLAKNLSSQLVRIDIKQVEFFFKHNGAHAAARVDTKIDMVTPGAPVGGGTVENCIAGTVAIEKVKLALERNDTWRRAGIELAVIMRPHTGFSIEQSPHEAGGFS